MSKIRQNSKKIMKIKNSRNSLSIIALVLLILGGIYLRYYSLEKSLSGDEFFSVDVVRSSNLSQAIKTVILDVHPPIFFINEYAIVNFLGESEINFRIAPFLFGILTIFISLLIVKILYDNEKDVLHYLVGVFLIIFSQALIEFSQEARPYSQLYFLSTILILLSLRKLNYKENRYGLVLIISISLVLTHYFGIFTVIAWSINDILINKYRYDKAISEKANAQIKPLIILLLASAVLILYYMMAYTSPCGLTHSISSQNISYFFSFPKWVVFNLVGHYYFNIIGKMPNRALELSDFINNLALIMPLAIALLIILKKVISSLKNITKFDSYSVLFLYAFLPFILAYIGCLVGILPFIREKYLISTLIPFLLISLYFVGYLNRFINYSLIALLFVLNGYASYNYYFNSKKIGRWEYWRDACEYLERNATFDEDLILWYSYHTEPKNHLLKYYSTKQLDHHSLCSANVINSDSLSFILKYFDQKKGKIFFIYYDNHRLTFDINSAVLLWLNHYYQEFRINDFGQRLKIIEFEHSHKSND